jgi:outer membrane receptor protein involved in Fe transport
VLRSASSVFYGSDAVGGVIHVLTRGPRFEEGIHGRFLAGYGTVNGEKRLGFDFERSVKSWAFSLSFQYDDAGEYRAPGGTKVLQSQYTQGSLLAKVAHRTDKREIDIGFLAARGTDIGKPNATASTKPTWYPWENQNLFQLHWKEKNAGKNGEILFHAFVNPNFLETLTDTYDTFLTKESFARTDSTEFGAQLSYSKGVAASLKLEGGVDYFGRGGADAYNSYTSYDGSGAVTGVVEEHPYVDGSRGDLGVFLSADYSGIERMDVLGGARYDLLRMKALPSGEASPVLMTDRQPTGFLAVSYELLKSLTSFVNISRA